MFSACFLEADWPRYSPKNYGARLCASISATMNKNTDAKIDQMKRDLKSDVEKMIISKVAEAMEPLGRRLDTLEKVVGSARRAASAPAQGGFVRPSWK